MKTEKRHAKVGEEILITNSRSSRYENGDRMLVSTVMGFLPGVWVDSDEKFVPHKEYEVIVE